MVVDASVVLKWFVEEEGTPAARQLLIAHLSGETALIAPDLLVYEVANVLRYNTALTTAELQEALRALNQFHLEFAEPSIDLLELSVGLARQYNVSTYDAAYLALAQRLEIKLTTADARLHRKIAKLNITELID